MYRSPTLTFGHLLFVLYLLLALPFAVIARDESVRQVFAQQPLVGLSNVGQKPLNKALDSQALQVLLDALDVLQVDYFATWQGIWPTSIDWTSAVIGTYLSSALITLSSSFSSLSSSKANENLVSRYFSQLVASYFGQNAFALRQEAYDDILWVVLGWLESIKFINVHSSLHYDIRLAKSEHWYGEQWIPAFAHRARIFWELASQGWDTTLCGGGMIWSPYLLPYKNAITNELWISASVSMYLYFPGDDNTSPFGVASGRAVFNTTDLPAPHDPKYLEAAIEAYKWLYTSNMTDAKGLYVDGYHISGYNRGSSKNNSSTNRRCDSRNEMVYTYNQGVLLSGQRGLYEATGVRSYLEDGHRLIADVIAATGWNLDSNVPYEVHDGPTTRPRLGKWHGLGRSGILEEACDAPGYCSQDAQTFKGILFHHLTQFCGPLPTHLVLPSKDIFLSKGTAYEDEKRWHDEQCKLYGQWIRHNANAALTTLDHEGRFGMWWGAPSGSSADDIDAEVELPKEAVDYRNQGVPERWEQRRRDGRRAGDGDKYGDYDTLGKEIGLRDLNDRGRGRTVETQGGGVAVLRALWELVDKR